MDVPLTGSAIGRANIDVTLTAPDGKEFAQSFGLGVDPAYPEISSRSVVQLAPKTGSVTVSADLLKDYVPGTGSIALHRRVRTPRSSLQHLIGALETYPYGCSEQLSSRLVAILLADDFGVKLADDAHQRAQDMIARILARQSSSGGFGLWSPGDNDLWLDAYVTDVLTRAREKGYSVPERAVSLALTRLKNVLGFQGDFSDDKEASDMAYAHYVLARNGRPIIGDLRYLGDSRINEIASPLARAQIAAALALAGGSGSRGQGFRGRRCRARGARGRSTRSRRLRHEAARQRGRPRARRRNLGGVRYPGRVEEGGDRARRHLASQHAGECLAAAGQPGAQS